MAEGGESLAEVGLVQASVSASVEQVGSSAMADPVGFFVTRGKKGNHFGSNRARGTGKKEIHAWYLCGRCHVRGKKLFKAGQIAEGAIARIDPTGGRFQGWGWLKAKKRGKIG